MTRREQEPYQSRLPLGSALLTFGKQTLAEFMFRGESMKGLRRTFGYTPVGLDSLVDLLRDMGRNQPEIDG